MYYRVKLSNLFCFIYFSSEAVSIAPSMTYETHVSPWSQTKERGHFLIGYNSYIVEWFVSQASLNEHADDNRSNDIGQGFKENSVAGKSLLSGFLTLQTKQTLRCFYFFDHVGGDIAYTQYNVHVMNKPWVYLTTIGMGYRILHGISVPP